MTQPNPYRPAPELQRVLDEINRVGNPLDVMTADNVGVLRFQREVAATRVLRPVPLPEVRTVRLATDGRRIPARLYRPEDRGTVRDGLYPVLVYFHGGGWTIGSITTYDSLCRALAAGSGVLVVSVEYRLAPEHPYPAAVADALAALRWVAAHADEIGGDPARVAVGGDSGGGTLATVAARKEAAVGRPPALQVLIYPSCDIARLDYPSHREFGEGHWLTMRALEKFRAFYLPDPATWREPDASPIHAADEDLRRLPPAVVMAAGCDPIRDEAKAYARRLRALGVPVECLVEPEMTHACLSLFNSPLFPEASRRVEPVLERLAEAVRRGLGGREDPGLV